MGRNHYFGRANIQYKIHKNGLASIYPEVDFRNDQKKVFAVDLVAVKNTIQEHFRTARIAYKMGYKSHGDEALSHADLTYNRYRKRLEFIYPVSTFTHHRRKTLAGDGDLVAVKDVIPDNLRQAKEEYEEAEA